MRTAPQILDRQFLEMRCWALDLAAMLDRIERASDAATALADPRMQQLHEALAILTTRGDDRAERIQMLFSDKYTGVEPV